MTEQQDFTGLYLIREGTTADHAFILATFLRGLYYGDSWFSLVPKQIFMDNYKLVIQSLLKSTKVNIKVACLKEDPDVILGYSICSDNDNIIHWVYIKSVWRKRGIAKSILPKYPVVSSHLSKLGQSLMNKYKNMIFNPFVDLT